MTNNKIKCRYNTAEWSINMSDNNTIEDLLDDLSDVIENGWSIPLSGGKVLIDGSEAKQILELASETIPDEIKKARVIVAERERILEEAKRQSDAMLHLAEEKVKMIISQSEIVRQSQAKANDIIMQGQAKYKEMRKASSDYVDDIMKRADESMTETLSELRNVRQNIRITSKKD